jgi:N-acyl-D-amino-acid deacylase
VTHQPNHATILIVGGLVVDGTGASARRADIALSGEDIAAVGDLAGWSADTILDAAGLVVAPGFIDMHSHSDLALLINGRAESKIRQGVTTEVIGMCGYSPAPAPENRREKIRRDAGAWGREVEWTWGSFGEYLGAVRRSGVSVNVVPIVGHGSIRTAVMGEEGRAPTTDELTAMQREVARAMEEGAFGMSTGLVYAPGMWADTDEVIALAGAMAHADGIYFSHIRSESDKLVEAIEEAARIGREAGVAVQIAHLKAEGRRNWGKTEQALEAIEQARESGVDVSYDCYPYTAWNTGLGQLLPAWAREGGTEAMLARLTDPETRARIRRFMTENAADDPGRWERRLISSVETEENRGIQGLTVAQVAAQQGQEPEEVVIGLLLGEQGRVGMVGFGMGEDDVRRVVAHPVGMIGSDASSVAPYGLLGKGHPHPRTYGTFARVLGRYVREENLLTLEAAVHKMTGQPAAKLGLKDRGLLAPGMAADICVFDPNTIADRATYQQPQQYAEGVRYVVVNGVVEVEGEEHRNRRAGRVLARG